MSNLLHRARFRRDHRWAPRRMSDYLDGELPSSDRERLERHSEHCPECRGVLHGLRRMLVLLHASSPRVSEPRAHEIAAAVRERLREPPSG